MKKTQRGITLIALIISIVVLLILAVVTVGSVKESGIIDKAQQAAKQSEISQIKEAFELKNAEELITSKLDKTPSAGFTLDDLDISEGLKSKYRDKLTISGGVLYYTDLLPDEEKGYFKQQGIGPLAQDSELKLALKDVVNDTAKTGDTYNLITVKNAIKQEKPNSICLILENGYNGLPTIEIPQETYLTYTNPTLLISDGNENLEIDINGNVRTYNGSIILMSDIEAMNTFGLKKIGEGQLEVITYKGSNPNVVVPTALYNDEGDITYGITAIGEEAFDRNQPQSDAEDVPVDPFLGGDSYEALTVQGVLNKFPGAPTCPSSIESTSTEARDKLRAIYECCLNGNLLGTSVNTTASISYGSDLVPTLYMDGMEFGIKSSDIDLVSIRISYSAQKIGKKAFYEQSKLTKVIMPYSAYNSMGRDVFYGCSELVGEGKGVYVEWKDSSIDIGNLIGFPWGAPAGTKFYLNGNESVTAQ